MLHTVILRNSEPDSKVEKIRRLWKFLFLA